MIHMEDIDLPEAFACQVAELSILFDCGGAFDCAKDTIQHLFHRRSGPWELGIVCIRMQHGQFIHTSP
jgi:hypothetical protein